MTLRQLTSRSGQVARLHDEAINTSDPLRKLRSYSLQDVASIVRWYKGLPDGDPNRELLIPALAACLPFVLTLSREQTPEALQKYIQLKIPFACRPLSLSCGKEALSQI